MYIYICIISEISDTISKYQTGPQWQKTPFTEHPWHHDFDTRDGSLAASRHPTPCKPSEETSLDTMLPGLGTINVISKAKGHTKENEYVYIYYDP